MDTKKIDIRLPEKHHRNDILVSEILFHPRTGGVDFVELYNASDKYLSIKHWALATKIDEEIKEKGIISNETVILAPGDYLAITENKTTLLADYPRADQVRVLESKAFPSLLADGGTLLLMDENDQIMQEVAFSPDWHHPLLKEPRGVSLERISWNYEENNPQYWQSAAANAGYATPGLPNSQWQNLQETVHQLQVDPPIFYPDQSGLQDYTHIRYQSAGSGNMVNLKVFDTQGSMVKQLAQNKSLSEEGFFIWDGTDDSKKRVNIGYYIIWMEVFKPDGSVNILKSKVAVGSKF